MKDGKDIFYNYLKWFEVLLKERVCSGITLSVSEDYKKVIIEFSKVHKKIIIRRDYSEFKTSLWGEIGFRYVDVSDISKKYSLLTDEIPAPGFSSDCNQLLQYSDTDIEIYYDIFGLCLWCLGRAEEYSNQKDNNTDQFARFDHAKSHAYQNNYLKFPVVDAWIQLIRGVAEEDVGDKSVNKQHFEYSISHDIDRIYRYQKLPFIRRLKRFAGDIINCKVFNALGFLSAISPSYNAVKNDPYNKFSYIFSLQKKYNFKSHFFVQAGLSNSPYDGSYTLNDKDMVQILKSVVASGSDIGLHPSFYAFDNSELLISERNELESSLRSFKKDYKITTSRMHYLRWSVSDSPAALSKAGIIKDYSMGYPRSIGFKAGTSVPYHHIDLLTGKNTGLIINPLLVMDCMLYKDDAFLPFKYNAIMSDIDCIIENVYKYGGVFSLLWHNSELDTVIKRKLFEHIIKKAESFYEG